MTDYLIGVDQKIPDWLMKRVFLGEVEAAIRSGIKSRFGILSLSTSDAILGLWFSFEQGILKGMGEICGLFFTINHTVCDRRNAL